MYSGKNTSPSVLAARRAAAAEANTPDNFKQAGVKLADPGTLSRSVDKALRGEAVGVGNINAQQQLRIARLNQQAYAGTISPEEYARQTEQVNTTFQKQQAERTTQWGKIAQVQGKSDRVNDATKRALEQSNTIRQTKDISVELTETLSLSDTPKQNPSQNVSKPNFNYSVSLFEGGKRDVISPAGGLDYLYGSKQLSSTGKVIQPAINYLDEYTQKKPTNLFEAWYMPYTQVAAGQAKQGLAFVGSLDNLGDQAYSFLWNKELTRKPIDVKETVDMPVFKNLIEGNELGQYKKDYESYFGKYNINSITGELSTFVIGASGVKSAAKVIPIRFKKFGQPGVKIFESSVNTKIKSPTGNLVKITTKEITPKQIQLGYGTKTKPILSKVGSKITLGDVNLSKISKVTVNPVTGKQIQRNIKMAADSTQFEQNISSRLIPKVEGITGESKDLAKIEEELVEILTKPKKDTLISKTLPEDAFSSVSKTEQPSFVGALTKAQKRTFNPIGTYEGSISHAYFVLPKFMRQFGDVDLHASTYEKAASQIKRLTPDIKADPGREFFAVTNEKTKSAKTFVKDLNFGGQPLDKKGSQYLNSLLTGKKTESIISKETQNLEFHHLTKGVNESGVILTTKEHIGITALMGQMGKTPKIKGSEQILKLFGEQKTPTPILKKEIEVFLSNPKNVEKTKSVLNKAYENVLEKGTPRTKKEKVIEILNPQEVDEKGISQSITGDTLFGKGIPKTKYTVDEGKTFGRQRQILKKFESLYSLQKDPITGIVELRPAKFRTNKEFSDAYALGKSAQEVEFVKGSKEYERLDFLLDKFKGHVKTNIGLDIDDYLSKNKIETPIELSIEKSTIQKIGSTSLNEVKQGLSLTTPLSKTRINPKEPNQKTVKYDGISISKYYQSRIRKPLGSTRSLYKSASRGSAIKKVYGNSLSSSLNIGKDRDSPIGFSPPSIDSLSPGKMDSPPKYSGLPSMATSMLSLGKSTTSPKERGTIPKSLTRSPGYTRGLSNTIPKQRVIPFGIINLRNTTKKTIGDKKKSYNFLGDTRVASIENFRTTEKTITVGDKKTERLYREDILRTKRSYRKSDKKNSKNLLSSSKKISLI